MMATKRAFEKAYFLSINLINVQAQSGGSMILIPWLTKVSMQAQPLTMSKQLVFLLCLLAVFSLANCQLFNLTLPSNSTKLTSTSVTNKTGTLN